MGSGTAMKREDALALADRVKALLISTPSPRTTGNWPPMATCCNWHIAGSLRRGRAEVGDIEIVAMSNYWYGVNVLNLALDNLLEAGKIAKAQKAVKTKPGTFTTRWGDTYRAFTIKDEVPCHIEIFQAHYFNWGAQLAIRTGAYEFGRMCMSKMKANGYNMEDGYLHFQGKIIACPNEAIFFNAVGFKDVPPPANREYDKREGSFFE